MQIAEVMVSSTYLHLACHESLKFNLYFIYLKTHEWRTNIFRLRMKSIHNISA